LGKQSCLELGNLDAKRNWSYAADHAEGIWRMLQHKKSDTFVLATNRTETVRRFVEMSFKAVDIKLDWQGKSEKEQSCCRKTGKLLMMVTPNFYRPAEVDLLIGDASKAELE